jgi:N6-adenosine-specific RNA methylase IME4
MANQPIVPADIVARYEVHEWRNGLAILGAAHPKEWRNIVEVLRGFSLLKSDVLQPGGSKGLISSKLDSHFTRLGWVEKKFDTKIVVDTAEHIAPTHKVDCYKNRVALEVEWNNKDPFYDRDLNNFRLLFELRAIDAGVIITRCTELQQIFNKLGRGPALVTQQPTWRNFFRGLKAAVEEDARLSSSAFAEPPMSKTNGHSHSSSPNRKAARYDDPRLPNVKKDAEGRNQPGHDAAAGLLHFARGRHFATILADPPWQFTNKTGKVAPEHRRLSRYGTMKLDEIMALPVGEIAATRAHLYLWCPNAMLPDGLSVMKAWGFTYKSNIVWHKVRKDGGSDGRGVGFYFRNVTELILFGVRGKNARTLAPGRRQVNLLATRKREHSRKPDEQYKIIEECSSGPFLELFARGTRKAWVTWGNQADDGYRPTWKTYPNHSRSALVAADATATSGLLDR